MPVFPHLNDSQFPSVGNVDVYKYRNEFDYSRFDEMQMRIQLCNVPWDMGEAHIGNRTISGIGNVVWFETEEKRDAWFDAIPDTECYRFETKYKQLHRDNEIYVPVPFDVASLFNYLAVDYQPFASEGDYVQYETPNGLRRWFWFVREVEFVAPNTTKLHLMNDAFQTFMYRMHFTGLILERGHAPMFETKADEYLDNPIENNAGLLAEDANYGTVPNMVQHETAHVFNADTYACIACTSNPTSAWGSKGNDDWHTPALASYAVDGVPNVRIFALEVASLNAFLQAIDNDYPQFKQSVKGVFFAPKELLTLGTSFTFAGTACRWVSTTRHNIDFLTLEKSQFGYDARYADIAKLYTHPYAHIEISDGMGTTQEVHIEDTTGKLQISAAMSLAYPALNVQAHLLGAGGSSARNITFSNITDRSLSIGGRWYETLLEWNVPTFGIVQSGAKHNDYDTHFDRAQQVTAYTNAYNSAVASANTAETNTKAQAATGKTNTDANADTLVANTAIQTAANTTITSRSNAAAVTDTTYSNLLSQALQAWEAGYARNTANNQVDAAYASAAIGAAGGAIGSAVSGGMSGAALGPAGIAAGAIGGLVSGAISGATTMAQTAVAANLTTTQAEATVSLSQSKVNETSTNNSDRTTNQNSANTANTATTNTASTGASANSAATMKANATRDKNTADANADRSNNTETANAGRARNTAQNAITNSIKQAALDAPMEFGSYMNTDYATTKPIALFANIVTQSKNAIEMAGDEFLRYGYYYNKQLKNWDGNWNVGKYFTYWKLKDFWVVGLNIPDMYVDKLRFFLFGGVTVWRRPEDIGHVSVYDNFSG